MMMMNLAISAMGLLMMVQLATAAAAAAAAAASDKALVKQDTELQPKFIPTEVCYDGLGCFSTGGNFYDVTKRPIQFVPQSPERISTQFFLYTRKNIEQKQRILYNLPDSVRNSNFDPRKPTKMVTHGFLEDTDVAWMQDMKRSLLLHGDYNVILIDWRKGNQLPYTQATANTRVVGAVTGQFIQWLEQKFSARRADFHIIAHSLGAHLAGYAGERLNGQLGRITGMDPAGPYFENTHPEVRLDPTDAAFVDAIHTDGDSILSAIKLEGGLGMMQAVGHVDFYPNGGMTQPNCDTNPIVNIIINGIIQGTKWIVACDHLRVMDLTTSTILNVQGDYKAVPCDSYESFKAGRCNNCGASGCASMGMNAASWRPNGRTNVKMFLDTTGTKPFELHHYVVTVTISGVSAAKRQYGDLNLELQSVNGVTRILPVVVKDYMEIGQRIRVVLTNTQRVYDISRIRVSWRHRWWFNVAKQNLFINRLEIFETFKERTSLYCGKDDPIQSGSSVWINASSRC